MALNKLKKFVTEEVMDEVSEDEYYDEEKVTAVFWKSANSRSF